MSSQRVPVSRAGLFLVVSSTLLFFLLTSGSVKIWEVGGYSLLPLEQISVPIVFCVFLLAAIACTLGHYRGFAIKRHLLPWLLIPLPFLLCTSWMENDYAFFKGPLIRGELLLASCGVFLLVRMRAVHFIPLISIGTAGLLFVKALYLWDDSLISSDDHLTFVFRLLLLKENFPHIPFYSPLWNAGFDARDFFATGVLNFYLLFYPFWEILPIEAVYNSAIAATFFVIGPAACLGASRLVTRRRFAPYFCILVSLAPGLLWFRWALKYGTMGCIVSIALFPLVFALVVRCFFETREASWLISFACIGATTLMLLWSPSGLTLVPLLFLAMWYSRHILKSRRRLFCSTTIVLLNASWMLIFLSVSNVDRFVSSSQRGPNQSTNQSRDEAVSAQAKAFPHKNTSFAADVLVKRLRELSTKANPFILLLGTAGIVYIQAPYRIPIALTSLWLLFVSIVGPSFKPQLELDRLFLFLSSLLVLPATELLASLLIYVQRYQTNLRVVLFSLSASFLPVGILVTISVLENKTLERYQTLTPLSEEFVNALKTQEDTGRVFFSGFILHELSGGHLAPLPVWINRPVLGYSFAHNMWKYDQMIDKSFLHRGIEGVVEFLDAFNVTTVVAHEQKWLSFFRRHNEYFTEEDTYSPFTIFSRKNPDSSFFLEGEGTLLAQSSNSVVLSLKTEDAIVKFRYFPFLQAEGCSSIEEYRISERHSFISLRNCKKDIPIILRSKGLLGRLAAES